MSTLHGRDLPTDPRLRERLASAFRRQFPAIRVADEKADIIVYFSLTDYQPGCSPHCAKFPTFRYWSGEVTTFLTVPGRAERAFTMEFESEGRTYNPFRDPVRSFVTEFAVFLKRDGAAPKAAAILPASGATMTEQPARKPSRKRAPSLSPPDAPQGAVDLARAIIREAVPSATESVKWNSPSFATSEHFATFFLRAKTGFQVVLHLGAKGRPGTRLRDEVRDPAGLLEWRGADRAIVTFVDEKDVRAKRDAFTSILRQWVGFL